MDAIEALKTRRSVRAYAPEAVPKDILEDIVDCGHLAATARNEQLAEFIVVTDAPTRAKLAELATNGKFIADAAACIVVVCRDGTYYLEDGCAALQNMLLAARAHGLGSCWVAGDKKPYAGDVLKALDVPKSYFLIGLVAVGYPKTIPNPSKRPIAEVLHWNRF